MVARQLVILFLMVGVGSGCMSVAASPKLGLQRSLYPGLGDLDATQIHEAFSTPVELHAPLSAGILWVSEGGLRMYGPVLSEYARSGILERAVESLEQGSFDQVASLPTTADWQQPDGSPSIDSIRGAAAKFQYDIAFILQTGLAQESGFNPFALGYLGLVTAPLFPGTDISVAAAAELCAVDVRSGVMLGCGIGRGYEESRFLFPWSITEAADVLQERMVAQAVEKAARDVLLQVARRVSP